MQVRTTRRRTVGLPARLLAALAVVAVVTPVPEVAAQTPPAEAATVSVSPPRDEFNATPGQTLTRTIRLTNGFTSPRTFNASAQNFEARGEEGQAGLTEDEGPYALKSWITITPPTATIQPSRTQDFTVRVAVPADAGPGGRYGAVVFSPVVSPEEGANLSIVSEVSSLLLVRIPGEAVERATIESLGTQTQPDEPGATGDEKSFYQKGPIDFVLRLNNQGNVHLRPEITVVVKNTFGSEIATLQAEPATALPGAVRRYTVPWDHKDFLGRYTATATVRYGEGGQTVTATTTFWGAPLLKIGIGLLVLLAAVLLLWLPRKRLKKAFKALTAGD